MQKLTSGAVAALILALLTPSWLAAQQERTMAGLETEHGGFGAVVFKGSAVSDQFAGFLGARGGWVLDHAFVLGAGGYWMASGPEVPVPGGGEDTLDLWYAGVEVEFISGWSEVYHLAFGTLIGGGSAKAAEESDGVWAVEPQLNLEINLTSHFRLDVGGGYRWVLDSDLPEIDSGDLSQFFGQLALKFGVF